MVTCLHLSMASRQTDIVVTCLHLSMASRQTDIMVTCLHLSMASRQTDIMVTCLHLSMAILGNVSVIHNLIDMREIASFNVLLKLLKDALFDIQ